jgi:peptide-methionine (S)-S-oxide reductase
MLLVACGRPGPPYPTRRRRPASAKGQPTAVLAGGCFWGIEAVFKHLKGVTEATPGYAGGSAQSANYRAVSGGSTGHAEAVSVTFDPSQVSYGQILKVFFAVAHDRRS